MTYVKPVAGEAISRRRFLKTCAAASGALAASQVPFVYCKKKITLRVLGTHVTLQEELRRQAMADLGIDIQFDPKGSAAVLQKASLLPQSFDLYEQWSNSIKILWQSKAIQPIEKERITRWEEINTLTKTGRLTDDAAFGAGDAPYKLLHVQPDNTLGKNATGLISAHS